MTTAIRFVTAALVAAGLSLAQDAPPAPPPAPEAPPAAAPQAPSAPLPAAPAATPVRPFTEAWRISTTLALAPYQIKQVQTILADRDSQIQPLAPQLVENRRAVQALAQGGATGDAFDAQIQKLATDQGNLLSQITLIRARTVSRIWAVLTPDQRARAATMPSLFNLGEGADRGTQPGYPRNRMVRPYPPGR